MKNKRRRKKTIVTNDFIVHEFLSSMGYKHNIELHNRRFKKQIPTFKLYDITSLVMIRTIYLNIILANLSQSNTS